MGLRKWSGRRTADMSSIEEGLDNNPEQSGKAQEQLARSVTIVQMFR